MQSVPAAFKPGQACSSVFEDVKYAVGRWVAGNMEAAITEYAMDP